MDSVVLKLSLASIFFCASASACDERLIEQMYYQGEYQLAYDEIALCETLDDLSSETIEIYLSMHMKRGMNEQDSGQVFAETFIHLTTLLANKGDRLALEMLVDMYSEDAPEFGFSKNLDVRDCLLQIGDSIDLIDQIAVQSCLALDEGP